MFVKRFSLLFKLKCSFCSRNKGVQILLLSLTVSLKQNTGAPWACDPWNHIGPCALKGPIVGLILCYCHLEISNLWTKGSYFHFSVSPANYIANVDKNKTHLQHNKLSWLPISHKFLINIWKRLQGLQSDVVVTIPDNFLMLFCFNIHKIISKKNFPVVKSLPLEAKLTFSIHSSMI